MFANRAPLHQGAAPKQKTAGRGNSPATGALAGGSTASTDQKYSGGIQSESKLVPNMNMEDSFQKLYSKELDLDEGKLF